jgi:hypothetical protein
MHTIATLDNQAPLGSETRTSCRDLVVLVNQATEAIPAPNARGSGNHIRPSPDLETPGGQSARLRWGRSSL